ncbi:MAG: hypothetical protein ACFE91_06695 [Promethearchaeota archaeon]
MKLKNGIMNGDDQVIANIDNIIHEIHPNFLSLIDIEVSKQVRYSL